MLVIHASNRVIPAIFEPQAKLGAPPRSLLGECLQGTKHTYLQWGRTTGANLWGLDGRTRGGLQSCADTSGKNGAACDWNEG